jgi:hypothetical protein
METKLDQFYLENKKVLEDFEVLYNSSTNQCKRLLKLCDFDLQKLERVFQRLRPVYTFCVPETKEELEELLNLEPRGSDRLNKL